MKFKTRETRDKNNVIKLYKGWGGVWGGPDNFGLINCSGYLILPPASPLCPPPADLPPPLPPPQLECIICGRSLFGVWPKPGFCMQSGDAAGTNLCSAEPPLGHADPGDGTQSKTPRGNVSGRAERHKKKRKVTGEKMTSL